jgi:two-component system, sensor histidine kinase ChiS
MDDISRPGQGLTVEETLLRERALLQYVIDNLPYLIFWKDRDSVYLGCNKNFAALDGRSHPDEIVGRTDHEMLWREHAELYRAGDRATMERGEPILNQEEISRDENGGEMVILTSKVPLRNRAGEVVGLLGMIVDITERKRIEVELHRAKDAAEQAARTKSRFIASISHELRTPLTLILGPVRDALAGAYLPGPTRRLLERVQRNGFRLYNLVNDVLDFARVEAGGAAVHRELLDVVAAARVVVEDMQPLARARGLSLELTSGAPRLAGLLDTKLFERVLLNLIGNALKFTPAGGWVRISLVEEQDSVRIDVSDNGIGIPVDAQAGLFEAFVQVDSSATRKYEGSGLGLALVKQFVQSMGGSVRVDSAAGAGSTFTVILPLHAGQADAGAIESPTDAHDPALGGRAWQRQIASFAPLGGSTGPGTRAVEGSARILVAEDHQDMRDYIVEILQPEFSVVAVGDGARAWECLQNQRFDVVVSDVMMPEMDGLVLTAKIKAHGALAHTPVILLTARGGAEAIATGLDAGADDYVAKPFAAEELRARARAAVRMSRLQENLRARSRQAGMSAVATGVLHNLGNVLNSFSVSSELLDERIRESRVGSIQKLAQLLTEHESNLVGFLTTDDRGKHVPEFIRQLADELGEEQAALVEEMGELRRTLDHVKRVVALHQGVVDSRGVDEMFAPVEAIETALRLTERAMDDRELRIERWLVDVPLLRGDRHKVLQILINLLDNARHALRDSPRDDKVLTVATERSSGAVRLLVTDNGVGIAPEVVDRIFAQGFTTRENAHGVGLHTSALLASELGGTLRCRSDGPGKGATFVLEMRIPPDESAGADRQAPEQTGLAATR